MWIDQDGDVHTVWVRAEEILGDEAVAQLRAVPRDVAEAAIARLGNAAMSVHEQAEAAAVAGPRDLDEVHVDDIPYPPKLPGLVVCDDEDLADTVLRYLSAVPPQWKVEALEAVFDVLDPEPADD